MKYLTALAFLAVACATSISVQLTQEDQCEFGPMCPYGCCPESDWECCPDGSGALCAATADDCPTVTKKIQLKKTAAPKQCQENECAAGTDGPGGCCPMVEWECCPDGLYCAPTLDDCPVNAKKTQVAKLAAPKQCDGDGPACPGGCCPVLDFICCPDGLHCAATIDDCPFAQH